MYNLLVTSQAGLWKKRACEYERGRSVQEYTDDLLSEKYKSLDKAAIAELLTFPTLFAYEDGTGGKARIGWLTAIKPRAQLVRLEFELEEGVPLISAARIKRLKTELDIGGWEMNRTHWALKDVDLISVLIHAGVLSERAIEGKAKDSRLLRFGLTRPLTEVLVRPAVFRVPTSKPENDLVSTMMPFDVSFSSVFEAIKSGCKAARLRCQRADDIWNEAEVIQDIFSLIYRSRLVICDFTGRNPNVFYEAGIAHTLGKPVIPIVQNEADIPFDMRHLRYMKYLNNAEGRSALTRGLTERLKALT